MALKNRDSRPRALLLALEDVHPRGAAPRYVVVMGKKKGGKAPPALSVIEVLVKDPGVRPTNSRSSSRQSEQVSQACLSVAVERVAGEGHSGLQLQAPARSLAGFLVPWLWRLAQHRSLICIHPS